MENRYLLVFLTGHNRQALPKPMLSNMSSGSATDASVMTSSDNRDRTRNSVKVPPDGLVLYHQHEAGAQVAASATSTNVGDIHVSMTV